MQRSEADHALFFGVWHTPPDPAIPMPPDGSPLTLFVPIHVDDGLASTNSTPLWKWFIRKVNDAGIAIKDLGVANIFLGTRIERDRNRRIIYLSQSPFIQSLLEDWKMDKCRGVSLPMECLPCDLPEWTGPPPFDGVTPQNLTKKYQSLIGSLTWLAVTT